MKIVIIGGVAGGATTAARLRRRDESAEIVMFERGAYISYANCGLPYYIGGTIPERDKLFVQTPESFNKRLGVEVRVNSEAKEIDRSGKRVRIVTSGNSYWENYDKLVLSPGAEPLRPPIPGINSGNIFTLRNVTDTDRIKTFIDEERPKQAVIIGGGFIGLEMAENLHNLGILVTLVEMADQVMNILDYEMAAEVHQHLKTKQVEFYLKDGDASFDAKNNHTSVRLKSGKEIVTDMVILSIGVKPETELAEQADLEIGKSGGIKVDRYMRTTDPDIYALGDAIEYISPISGTPVKIPLAGPANKQGRIIADNIADGDTCEYKGTLGTGIAKVFDLTVASTGLAEKVLSAMDIPHQSVITHSGSNAGYYPGAIPLTIKTIFSPKDGKLLGAQIVGYTGVDKRIDVMAAVIGAGGTVYDLQEFEHAYAPPYSSAKDPVNIAGFVADNVLAGISGHIHWDEIAESGASRFFLLDVRTPDEYSLGTIEGAVNIPVDDLRARISEVPKIRDTVVFCGVGQRAYIAERILRQNGYDRVRNLSGGYKTFSLAVQKQSNEDIFAGDFVGKDDVIYQTDVEKREGVTKTVDACGLQCPGPIMRLKTEIEPLEAGDRILQKASDPGFGRDVESWCTMTGNTLIELKEETGMVTALIEKGSGKPSVRPGQSGNGTSIIVFSDDLDRALASFVIANGAAAAGKDVTMFFTFWGLNVIKKDRKPRVKKDFMGRMFSRMLPSSSRKLSLSKLHMMGMGDSLMRKRMKKKNVSSLEEMISSAKASGVRLVGCQMSMDLMGVSPEELVDGVEVGGVATFLQAADGSQASLFI